jgi:hypothetical protein
MNHTKGPITVGEYDENAGYDSVTGGIKVGPLTLDAADYGQETAWSDNPWDRERMEADAALIAEAFNVATESGLTPKQMLERLRQVQYALNLLYGYCVDAEGLLIPHSIMARVGMALGDL